MDDEFKKRLVDYFTGPELVDLLNIPVEELVEAFADTIEENKEELSDYISYGR